MSIKNIFIDILFAFSFLSRIPINLKDVTDWQDRVKRSPRFFTLLGYLPGLIYFVGASVCQRVCSSLAIIFLAFGYYYFDLFHYDGLLDMFDGFLNQSDAKRRLEIMAKGNVGAFAVFYGILVVFGFIEFMKISDPYDFVLAGVLGRATMNIVLITSSPAKSVGLGVMLYPPSKFDFIISLFWTIPLAFIQPYKYLLSLAVIVLVGLIISKISKKLINGITGDVLGGSCLLAQVFILLFLNLSRKIMIIK